MRSTNVHVGTPFARAGMAAISKRAKAAESIRLVGIRNPTLPSRVPERQAHTCTIPWWEEFQRS